MTDRLIFSVEQLELIRRLRNSGLSKSQVLSAFDSFEKLDQQLNISNGPSSAALNQVNAIQRLAAIASNVTNGLNHSHHLEEQLNNRQKLEELLQQQQQLQHHQQVQQQQQQFQQLQQQICQHLLLQQQQQQLHQGLGQVTQRHASVFYDSDTSSRSDDTAGGCARYKDSGNANGTRSNGVTAGPKGGCNVWDRGSEVDPKELKEFLSQGEVGCCEEIKAFVAKHSIKQQQIASLAGVSQPYVSRYLKGDFTSMSERCCHSIKTWFIAYRNTPDIIASAASAAAAAAQASQTSNGLPHQQSQQPQQRRLLISQQLQLQHASPQDLRPLDLHTLAASGCYSSSSARSPSSVGGQDGGGGSGGGGGGSRRERFVFRPCHLDILEQSFVEEPYPSFERREEIVRACNEATMCNIGREPTDRERVAVQIITNWFANKRKDTKKLRREVTDGGYCQSDQEGTVLRSRGRPTLSSDISLLQSIIDQRSSINHSSAASSTNSDNIDSRYLNGKRLYYDNSNEATAPSSAIAFDEVIDYSVTISGAADAGNNCHQSVNMTDIREKSENEARPMLSWSPNTTRQPILSLSAPVKTGMSEASSSTVNDSLTSTHSSSEDADRSGSLNTPPLSATDLS